MASRGVFVAARKGIPFSESMVHLCTLAIDCIECWTDGKI